MDSGKSFRLIIRKWLKGLTQRIRRWFRRLPAVRSRGRTSGEQRIRHDRFRRADQHHRPEEGAPASVRVAAISAKTDQPEVAKKFIEFLFTAGHSELLVDAGDEGYFEPSVAGVKKKIARKMESLFYAEASWASEHEAEIKEWFADESAK